MESRQADPQQGHHDSQQRGEPSLIERLGDTSGLRNSERKVAQLVLENPGFVVNGTMAAVSEAAGVSEPTLMRFCTSIGYDGFQSFKLALARALALGIPATISSIQPTDDLDTVSTKVFDHTISSLDRARRLLDHDQIGRAVDAIVATRVINLAGVGASALIAQDAEQKAPLFGVPCTAPPDPHQQFMAAATSGPDIVTMIVSNTGRTQSMIQVAETARTRGSTVIGISGEEDAPLLTRCDIPLVVRTIEDTDLFTPTVSRLAGLVVIDILATMVTLRRGEEHLHRLSEMKRELADYRGRYG